ncbi:MAG: TolC family protein, partial [Polaromonas sp.]|nr:TolC family protein [Polaromonas sp.]
MNLKESLPVSVVAGIFSQGQRVAVPYCLKNTLAALMLAGVAFGALALVFPAPAFAQATGKPLTLKEAAQNAVLNNPEVLARWHTIKAADGERDVGAGALLPKVDLAAGSGAERRNATTTTGSRFDRNSASLTITQLLYDGFATRNDVKRLDHARLVRLFEFFDTSESVALEAVKAYYDVLRYRELLRLAEDNFVQHRSVFDQTERRVKAKVARAVDLEQISARLALAEANLLIETSNLHDTTARFQRIVGLMPTRDMPVPAPLMRDIPENASGAIRSAQQRNGALRASIESVRASNAALASRSGAYQPRFDLRLRRE